MKKLTKDERVLHERFVEYGGSARKWLNKCKLMLLEINQRRIWEKRGFSSLYEYAAKLAGLNKAVVENSLWILRKLWNLPELKKVAVEKGLNSVKPVIGVVMAETDAFWAKKAQLMPVRTLETYVRDWKKRFLNNNQSEGSDLELFSVIGAENRSVVNTLHVESSHNNFSSEENGENANKSLKSGVFLYEEDASDRKSLVKKIVLFIDLVPEIADDLRKLNNNNWSELMERFLELRRKELEQEMPEPVETSSRYVPVMIERFVLKRSNCICEFPACMRKYTELHHADRFKLVWKHDPSRIFALCKHHHKLAHQGLIEGEGKDIRFWRVREDIDERDLRFGIDQLVMKFQETATGE